ncbi:MAG TPA: hypothetical protein VEF76_02930 [Patescibacteria group bacterium]|nr:hypothetical protein [Patescibacteria group bacterium]
MKAPGVIAGLGVALLFCALGAAVPADASSPKQDWEIGPINAASPTGVKFCSMKNIFEGGHMLVVARDAEGSNSLAISFPEKLLQSGGQYTVDISAGKLTRRMIALAGTPQVLLIQMGLDREFYAALQKQPALTLSFAKQNISFSLTGTQDALNSLTQCATDVSTGKSFKPTTVAVKTGPDIIPPDAAPGQNLGTETAKDTLKGEIERLRLENRRLIAENAMATAKALAEERAGIPPHLDIATTAGVPEDGMAAARAAVKVTFPAEAAMETGGELPAVDVTARITAKPDTFLADIMQRAQIPATRQGNTYSWNDKDLFGAAEQRVIPHGGSLQDAVNAYVEQAKARCKGDFAHNESAPVKNVRGAETVEGEFACIDGENDAAAALLFVAQQGKVAIIAHEGSTDQMEDALSDRAAVISNLSR